MAGNSSEPLSDRSRTATEILAHEVEQGLSELRRPVRGLFRSALSAGLDVSFGILLMATVLTRLDGVVEPGILRLIIGNVYAVGFVFVIIGRSELFTEHTTLAVFPVLARKASMRQLARLWAIVWFANLLGAALFAAVTTPLSQALHFADAGAYATISHELVRPEWPVAFGSAVLAGWLMGLMSWLVAAARDTIGQIVIVWLVASAIGMMGLHHCIVGTMEVLAGVFAGVGVSLADYGHFLLWATLGNIVGGTVFVALLKFGHVSQPGPETEGEGDG